MCIRDRYTLVPESSVKDLDISVEDAFRTIISAGIVNPDEKNNTSNPTFSKLFSQLRASTNTSSWLMYNNRSLSRELSLISLGLIKDKGDFKLNKFQIEEIFESALDSLINHCRDELDNCESELENASQKILESELHEGVKSSFSNVRDDLKNSLKKIETVMLSLIHISEPTRPY